MYLFQATSRKYAGSEMGGSGGTTEEERGDSGVTRGPGETQAKRQRVDGSAIADALLSELHHP